MRIVLVRHGPPDMPTRPALTARELATWVAGYDAAGIRPGTPPASTVAAVSQCRLVVTSDLKRSQESARRLGQEPALSEPLFREAGLPYDPLPLLRLPPLTWAVLFRVPWLFGYSRHGESFPAFRQRVRQAGDRLSELAAEHDTVALIGHGVLNRFVARQLLAYGWVGPANPGLRHWAFGEYRKPG